ncbi:hypothetical protein RM550_03625 [Streptomyces sp. DSM 41527]|uniref:Transposase n=1 Tax=Streptomyces mooreae TaxID=3075523 RepID=A0ABU2T0T7_9ACTN|nr:hypothetical protein [Streptomyces sp. DSM 41527]MDT0454832.1 hypothetical protein [Streptomyces sp. DSM 41527]
MEEDDRQSYRRAVARPLADAEDMELVFEERLRELMADPARLEPLFAVLSRLAEWVKEPVSDGQAPDSVWVDGERLFIVRDKGSHKRAGKRLWRAAWGLRHTKTTIERRDSVREFLAALAELSAQLLQMLARVLLVLLSRLLGRTAADDVPAWKPVPIDSTPQIAPRGPNPAFPVNINRGGHRRSTLGSVVLAA